MKGLETKGLLGGYMSILVPPLLQIVCKHGIINDL